MAGCNCSGPVALDPACCVVKADDIPCVLPVPKPYYCGFCENGLHSLACQVWVDCCSANRSAVTLASLRFKTQTGRDAVFGMLQFSDSVSFSKYVRFPSGMMVNLNTPSIFDTLVSIASAAAFRDRLGEKTHFQGRAKKGTDKKSVVDRGSWSYNDASNAFHKHVTLLRSLLRKNCVSRQRFESSYGLKWVPAGTPIMSLGSVPFLGQLNQSLQESCFGLWMAGAFAVEPVPGSDKREPSDLLSGAFKYDNSMIVYPANPWNTPLACDGNVMLFRSDGSIDVIPYHYECRKFQFGQVAGTKVGNKEELNNFIKSVRSYYTSLGGNDFQCPGWLDVVDPPEKKEKDKPTPRPSPAPKPPTPNPAPPHAPVTPDDGAGPSGTNDDEEQPTGNLDPDGRQTDKYHNESEYSEEKDAPSDSFTSVKVSGSNMLQTGYVRQCDPYLVAFVNRDGVWKEIGRTNFVRGDSNPKWEEEIRIPEDIGNDSLVKFRAFNVRTPFFNQLFSIIDWREQEAIGTALVRYSDILNKDMVTVKLTEEETGRKNASFGFLKIARSS